jgi:hypothetical protein
MSLFNFEYEKNDDGSFDMKISVSIYLILGILATITFFVLI